MLALGTGSAFAAHIPDMKFRRLDTRDGLSNSQPNCVFKDSQGYVWIGTPYGLNRYDGYRMKVYYSDNNDTTTLKNNYVDDIMEAYDGKLWIKQSMSYCIFDPLTERFDRNPGDWLAKQGIEGGVAFLFIDREKNFWVTTWSNGCYFYNPHTEQLKHFPIGYGAKELPNEFAMASFEQIGKGQVLITSRNGQLVALNAADASILWKDDYILKQRASTGGAESDFTTYCDPQGNLWVLSRSFVPGVPTTFVYVKKERKWYNDIPRYLASLGIDGMPADAQIWSVRMDTKDRLWIATDHYGLFVTDMQARELRQFTNDTYDETSVSDITLKNLYLDEYGRMWICSYKNGVNLYTESLSNFNNLELGDINTIIVDRQGRYWLGTNDRGIVVYDPQTGEQHIYNKDNSGFASNVMVSSWMGRDGSLWFGTYEGGLMRYRDGHFKVWRSTGNGGGLATNNVWDITEDRWGFIWIGTLGGGVQRIDPRTETFRTFNQSNSQLGSDYVSSMMVAPNGQIIVGHSEYFSLLNPGTAKFTNMTIPQAVNSTSGSPSTSQAIIDNRGLIYQGSVSGLLVFDRKGGKSYLLDMKAGMMGSSVVGVIEDHSHNIWAVTDYGVSQIVPQRQDDGLWSFNVRSFNSRDGLQHGPYNQRAIFVAPTGQVLLGGQGGLDIINPLNLSNEQIKEKPIFSGLVLFDREISAGDEYDGRVIIDEAINVSRKLALRFSENQFTIQLASNNGSISNRARFIYKLEGFNDKWIKTSELNPNVTYMSLPSGSYTLCVRMLNDDGSVGEEESRLDITIYPPFYRSWWAILFYLVVFGITIYFSRRGFLRRQAERMRIEAERREVEKHQLVNEMKMKFYTNVSHELRTPLTLIISPIRKMLKDESDEGKRKKLGMVERNAEQLLTLVNQLLDIRKQEATGFELHPVTGDIVALVKDVCSSFSALDDKNIELSFMAKVDQQLMQFDVDKMQKVLNNLLNNSFKFTPKGGQVKVSVGKSGNDHVQIQVADSGVGIKDEYKEHIFDRYYQTDNKGESEFGSSGIGLNLVKDFVELHHGTVTVADTPGGGTIFTITLPLAQPEVADPLMADTENAADVTEVQPDIEDAVAEEITSVPLADGNKPIVLIVDDSEDFLEFMDDYLSEQYTVLKAENGRQALEVMARQRPDIVLSDVMMPEMDGNELCQAIKQNEETRHIPVIMLSARLAEEHKIESLAIGADDYITKPFNLDLLSLRIDKLLPARTEQTAARKIVPEIHEMEITSVDEKLIKNATQYIEDNLDNSDLSVETMSEHLGMSRVHLYKKMLSITGSTPSEFIRQIRLRHAEVLLRKSQLTVSEVAYKVGFNNPRYFSKYFKEMYGVMPSQYKQESAAED